MPPASDSPVSDQSPVSARPQNDSDPIDIEKSTDSTLDRSAELLRLALPMISRHGRGFTPISYAIWYEYVRGENSPLRNELDETVSANERISVDATFEIYQRHVVGSMEKAVLNGRAGLLEVLEEVDNSVDRASESTTQFGSQLTGFVEAIGDDASPDQIRGHIDVLKTDIDQVNSSINGLHEKLDASRQEVEKLVVELAQAKEQAQIDPLSGLLNRRGFDETLKTLIDECSEGGSGVEPLAIVLLDIDFFKKINDEHGHVFGDKVIQGVGKMLHGGVMRKDFVCRIGGEEFAILLPHTDKAGAIAVGERVREVVARSRIKRSNSDEAIDSITISGGVSVYRSGEDATEFVDRADQALYRAKENGRDQICT